MTSLSANQQTVTTLAEATRAIGQRRIGNDDAELGDAVAYSWRLADWGRPSCIKFIKPIDRVLDLLKIDLVT